MTINSDMQNFDSRNSRPETVSEVSNLPFSLINLLKCSPTSSENRHKSLADSIFSSSSTTRMSSMPPILSQHNLPTILPISSSSIASTLLKSTLANGLSLASFDPFCQLAALKLLQETNSKIKSSIAVPVPVRVAPYPTSRPIRTTPSPLTSPAMSFTSPHTRHSSSEESTISSSSLPYPKYSPFGDFPLYRKEFLLEEKSPNKKSAFQQVSPDANNTNNLLRSKLQEQVMRGMNTTLLNDDPLAKTREAFLNQTRNNHVCKYCEKTFPSPSHLLIHLRTHSGERPYPCPGCGKTFATRGHLRRHYRIHTGVKPYKCQVCDKAFANQGNLKTHTRLHTGEKPYKCPRCEKAFADAGNLQRHITTHTGVKPYKCIHCNKAFSRSSNLKTHLLTHTGLKPFSCTCCNKSFTRLSYLKAHMKGIRHVDKTTCSPTGSSEQNMSVTNPLAQSSMLSGDNKNTAFRPLKSYIAV